MKADASSLDFADAARPAAAVLWVAQACEEAFLGLAHDFDDGDLVADEIVVEPGDVQLCASANPVPFAIRFAL
jgi:hypothetical protein